jgi:hypothetical protein
MELLFYENSFIISFVAMYFNHFSTKFIDVVVGCGRFCFVVQHVLNAACGLIASMVPIGDALKRGVAPSAKRGVCVSARGARLPCASW